MSKSLHTLLDHFHSAIMENDATLAPALRARARLTPQQQMAIYSDGYRTRLTLAIRSDYPELPALLGDAEFERLAANYIAQHPPTGFNLDRYPHAFAAFVSHHSENGFAIAMATLEAAIAEIFMAQDSAPLETSALAGLTEEQFSNLTLRLRTASRLLALDYPAEKYVSAIRAGNAPLVPAAQPQYLFVVRHDNEVRRHILSLPQYRILSQLGSGTSVGDALEQAVAAQPECLPDVAANLQNWFAHWSGNGFFQSLTE